MNTNPKINRPCIIKRSFIKTTFFLILFSLTSNLLYSQFNLGWTGQNIIPSEEFTDKLKWTCNYQQGTGDSCYITTNDSCVLLHWKFGAGKRTKYAQSYFVLNPGISLDGIDIISFDVKGSACKRNRDMRLKFEDWGNPNHQPSKIIEKLSGVLRWCERISILKKEFEGQDVMNWNTTRVFSIEVFSKESDNDVDTDSGVLAIKKLQMASVTDWQRAASFEDLQDNSTLQVIKKRAISAILNRQDNTTGLFCTWLPENKSFLYGQGLVLKLLSLEGKWVNSVPQDSCAKAAEKLALFLSNNHDKHGFWPRAWHTKTGNISTYVEDDGTVWMGDFPWIITGLQNYLKKSCDTRVKSALDRATSFLYQMTTDQGLFYTLNINTQQKIQVTSTEAYAAAILSFYELGDSVRASRLFNYIHDQTWDSQLKYWKEATGSSRIVLFANTWMSQLAEKTFPQNAMDALSLSAKTLYTKGPGEPSGLDGIGPVATWYEGTLSYICAGGPKSQELFTNISNYIYPDGTVPHYNDSITAAGVWSVKWSSLDGTAWLYYAASKTSPFDVFPASCKVEPEPKKVLMHYMGWYGDSAREGENKRRHWKCGYAHKPLIGEYDSHSWSLLNYHVLLSYSCGIDGLVANVKDTFDEQTFEKLILSVNRLKSVDSSFNYDISISLDDQGMNNEDTAINKLNRLKDIYIPLAEKNYLHYYKKPAIFVYNYKDQFPEAKDYRRIADSLFDNNPLIIWNQSEDYVMGNVDACYPWVPIDNDPLNWGKGYINDFFWRVDNKPAEYYTSLLFTCGGVWPGFNDTANYCWDLNNDRIMDRQNGMVYDSTWIMSINYPKSLPLKWVILETWNDWNEGSEIEPSVEFGYQYLDSTIKKANIFKQTSLNLDNNRYTAAKQIYEAGKLIEDEKRDSTKWYPVYQKAVKSFIQNNFIESSVFTKSIIEACTNSFSEIYVQANKDYLSPSGKYIWSANGTYLDTILNAAGCDSIITINLLITSIALHPEEKIKVYPIPTNGILKIENVNIKKIELFSSSGRLLIETERTTIDMSKFGPGIYTLIITDKNNFRTIRKVIYQR